MIATAVGYRVQQSLLTNSIFSQCNSVSRERSRPAIFFRRLLVTLILLRFCARIVFTYDKTFFGDDDRETIFIEYHRGIRNLWTRSGRDVTIKSAFVNIGPRRATVREQRSFNCPYHSQYVGRNPGGRSPFTEFRILDYGTAYV